MGMSDLVCEGERAYRAITVLDRGRFHRQQAFEDAIAFRNARLAGRCRACAAMAPGARCDKHARDLQLIAEYQQTIERLHFVFGPAIVPCEHSPSVGEDES
jgi:hypothetical protein